MNLHEKEPVHEWIWYRQEQGKFYFTPQFHTEQINREIGYKWTKFEPSKRIKNER